MEKSLQSRELGIGELGIPELMAILNTPGPFSLLGIRNRALMAMAITSGLWGHEMWKLKCGDFERSSGTVQTGKKVTPLEDICTRRLIAYLGQSRPHLVRNYRHETIFVSISGIPLDSTTGGLILKNICKNAGIQKTTFTNIRKTWGKMNDAEKAELKEDDHFSRITFQ